MISVSNAISICNKKEISLGLKQNLDLDNAVHWVVAETVFSPIFMPPFRQSAMDGYAIRKHSANVYQLIGEVKAGDSHQLKLKQGEAIRIFTGAAVPDTADAVVMQEKVTQIANRCIELGNDVVSTQQNIRSKGEQLNKGELVLKSGVLLTPAAIGFLKGLGVKTVKVYKKPKITLIVTGDELVESGSVLPYGKIYESNSAMLACALHAMGYLDVSIKKVKDNFDRTKNAIKTAIASSDVVILSGGISVGDYDFVAKALHDLKVNQLFYKVNQKPGKPLFFGEKNRVSIFGLPGNPAASLTCFYVYVYPVLKRYEGLNTCLTRIKYPLEADFIKKGTRAQFLKAKLLPNSVSILNGQSSAMLNSFSVANALVYIPETSFELKKGDLVEVILLP